MANQNVPDTTAKMKVKYVYRLLKKRWSFARYHLLEPYVFIHINKTGGSSIEKALNIPFEHKTALEKISEIGIKRWQKKYSFTVVRNPWDKVVSHYHFRLQNGKIYPPENPIGFREWVIQAYHHRHPAHFSTERLFMPQVNWISDADGNVLLDRILRFERLEADFIQVLTHLGLQAKLPHEKQTDRGRYQQYFDVTTRRVVEQAFWSDIEYFEYQF